MIRPAAGIQRVIGEVYSWAADKLYQPVIVEGAFPLFGGDLDRFVTAQGRRAVESARGRPILDAPVGTAHFTVRTASVHTGMVVGTDLADGMVREARRIAVAAGVEGLVLVRSDIHALPFKRNAFGAILCTNGLQVIPGLEPAVRELARVLAPGARLYLSVITVPLGLLFPPEVAGRLPTLLKSKREIIDALVGAGLSVTSVTTQRLATFIEALKPALSS